MRYTVQLPSINNILSELTDDAGNIILSVGDSVYYITDDGKYTIKKSVVKEIRQKGNQLIFDEILSLENGREILFEKTFATKDEAVREAIEQLKKSIASNKRQLKTVMQRLRTEERILESKMKSLCI